LQNFQASGANDYLGPFGIQGMRNGSANARRRSSQTNDLILQTKGHATMDTDNNEEE
jgi:hypothetical protein